MDGSLAEAQAQFVVDPNSSLSKCHNERIGVIGLGYVGLPVSIALAEAYEEVIGFDINPERIQALKVAEDWTGEVDETALFMSTLRLTSVSSDLAGCTVYVVAVPTPVDASHQPDLAPLKAACRSLAPLLGPGDLVVFESTVYPGATEEVCGPELEQYSGLAAGKDFYLAYSPERITPGDNHHKLKDVPKIVSADTPSALERIAKVYERIVPAGVYRAPSIKVAEAAKVFENTQRDVNIALMNEFSQICSNLGIRTRDVVHATGTKWNALPFTPGLVGGHCIGVDPFYLAHKAQVTGSYPEIILASRRRNDSMASTIAQRALKFLCARSIQSANARVGVFGITFKENVPDMRNSKVMDLLHHLKSFGINPIVSDPIADPIATTDLGVELKDADAVTDLDILIMAVPHDRFRSSFNIQNKIRNGGVLMDVRSVIEPSMLRRDVAYWSL